MTAHPAFGARPLHWSAGYVGIPFLARGRSRAGADCWGLVRMVLAERRGIALPSYAGDYVSVAEKAEIAALVDAERAAPAWLTVSGPPVEFDVLLFRLGRLGRHVGIVCGAKRMLHVPVDAAARIEDFTGPRFSDRLIACYRHESLR